MSKRVVIEYIVAAYLFYKVMSQTKETISTVCMGEWAKSTPTQEYNDDDLFTSDDDEDDYEYDD